MLQCNPLPFFEILQEDLKVVYIIERQSLNVKLIPYHHLRGHFSNVLSLSAIRIVCSYQVAGRTSHF